MKNLLYVGNYLQNNRTNPSYMLTLGNLLKQEGYSIIFTSNKDVKVLRLIDMIMAFFKNKKHIDYVLIDTYSTYNFYYALVIGLLCKLFNKRYITILHGGNLPNRLDKAPKLSKQVFNNAYINVSPSLYIKQNFEKRGYSNVRFIPNTLHIDNYPYSKRSYKTIKLLWVRSFSKIYNPKMAIAVLSELIKKGYQAELCMVGPDTDGSLKEVQDYAKQLDVKVRFTGKLTKGEWCSLSNNYNVFINTTNFDNMPVSVIEAMALGLPIISTNVGGMPYLIQDKVHGILIPINNIEEMTSAIIMLFDNENFTNKLTLNARRKVEELDWSTIKHLWLDVLH